tara:strand:+ start:700 stop:966 length:267 start_codon:yes stop_codon:yes gene_type:complete
MHSNETKALREDVAAAGFGVEFDSLNSAQLSDLSDRVEDAYLVYDWRNAKTGSMYVGEYSSIAQYQETPPTEKEIVSCYIEAFFNDLK